MSYKGKRSWGTIKAWGRKDRKELSRVTRARIERDAMEDAMDRSRFYTPVGGATGNASPPDIRNIYPDYTEVHALHWEDCWCAKETEDLVYSMDSYEDEREWLDPEDEYEWGGGRLEEEEILDQEYRQWNRKNQLILAHGEIENWLRGREDLNGWKEES